MQQTVDSGKMWKPRLSPHQYKIICRSSTCKITSLSSSVTIIDISDLVEQPMLSMPSFQTEMNCLISIFGFIIFCTLKQPANSGPFDVVHPPKQSAFNSACKCIASGCHARKFHRYWCASFTSVLAVVSDFISPIDNCCKILSTKKLDS